MDWIIKKFKDLSTDELYAILQLRIEVFVVEQNCPYQEADNKDQESMHLMGLKDGKLIAYTRILPPGLSYEEPSIGRVVTSPSVRGNGIGKLLMERSMEQLEHIYGKQPIRIGAQLYLKKFYESLGFVQGSELYLEDNIEHIEMVRY